jgi:hypothetical protein
MTEQNPAGSVQDQLEGAGEGLRQALFRLTSPRYAALQEAIDSVQEQLTIVEGLRDSLVTVKGQLTARDQELDHSLHDLQVHLQEAHVQIDRLSGRLEELNKQLKKEIIEGIKRVDAELTNLERDLDDPDEVAKRIEPVFVPVLHQRVQDGDGELAEVISPVIGPAIRHQIRSAKQDIIDALYPVIGQIISKAISEEIRELTHKIDTQLRGQFNLGSRIRLILGRLRGVSLGEQILREALPYEIHHVFLIHHKTGLILEHLTATGETVEDADVISGMLTAIRDFVRDSFGQGEGELEEITQGDQRVLIEGGQYAYVAIVLEGVEPTGYSHFVRSVVSDIHVNFEADLRGFDGELGSWPDLTSLLQTLFSPGPDRLMTTSTAESLSRSQLLTIVGLVIGGLLLIAAIIFACIFTVRLWPLAFP